MRLIVAAVGKIQRAAPEQELFALYLERARGLGVKLGFTKLDCITVDTSRAAGPQGRQDEEAKRLIVKSPPGARRIALDEAGRTWRARPLPGT
jgi:23S rRNA pseudoU1915 N3-methylase RlmH